MCVGTVCLRSVGTRLVCGFLRGNQRLMGTRLCLLTADPAILEGEEGKILNNKCCNKKGKEGKKRKQKALTLVSLRGITKTFTGKQAQSGNSGNHFGGRKKSRRIWANLSGGAIKSRVSARTRRRGRKHHLETGSDIRLSGN